MPQGMKERRVYDGSELVFDARDILDRRKHKSEILVKMQSGPLTYETSHGVKFWKDHPFQWVQEEEVNTLLESKSPIFTTVNFEQLEDYYAY